MSIEWITLITLLIAGFYMAWNIGANDVSNAMGTSVGSGALTLRRAVILAAIFEFAGAFLVGSYVTETVQKGIVDPIFFIDEPLLWVYGMIATLLAAGAWLQLASYFGWPVSTTHSIVGALVGFGMIAGGSEAVAWDQIGMIVLSWIISPLFGGVISYCVFTFLRRSIFLAKDPIESTRRVVPFLVFGVLAILSLVVLVKGLKNVPLRLGPYAPLWIAIAIGSVGAVISVIGMRNLMHKEVKPVQTSRETVQLDVSIQKVCKHLRRAEVNASPELRPDVSGLLKQAEEIRHSCRTAPRASDNVGGEYQKVEKMFSYLQILSACSLAFAHGANDVANAIGPLSGGLHVLQTGQLALEAVIPPKVLFLGGIGIVIGLATWGWRVIETIGKRITELTPSRGFSAEFGAALTIVAASLMGLPVSTTHILVGAVLGVGLARGLSAINLDTVRDIVISWIVTVPAGAGLAILFFYLQRALLGY